MNQLKSIQEMLPANRKSPLSHNFGTISKALFILWVGLLALYTLSPVVYAENISVLTPSGRTVDFYNDAHALVVGVGHYDHWSSHPQVVDDTREVSRALQQLGFTVKLLKDPTAQELRSALDEFAHSAGSVVDRGLVFYYSGNSQTMTSTDGVKNSWIIPKDAPHPEKNQHGFEEKAISADEIAAIADRIESKHVLFLFNATLFSSAFQIEPAVMKMVSQTTALPTRRFITAGVVNAPNLKNNPFKRYFILGLSGEADLIRDGVVSGSELGLYLSDRVGKVTGGKLQPQFGWIAGGTDNRGDFVFQMTDIAIPLTARLFVDPQPASATTRILNIKPKFTQGMELEPGEYKLHVSAAGYESIQKTILLEAGEDRTEKVELTQTKQKITNSLGMRFIRIRPGSFMMGSPQGESGHSNDETRHRVKLTRAFFMQSAEVSAGQFKQFVNATGYTTEAEKDGGCWMTGSGQGWSQKAGTSWKKPGLIKIDNNLPALCITWNDARAFARWLGRKENRTYRLPTEAEWEYACRAGKTTSFSTGRCLSTDEANYGTTGHAYQKCTTVFRKKRGHPIKVGSLAPNPWKLNNMNGNVSEWCQDWYGSYPTGSATNPKGPKSGSERVMRGGHWQADLAGCRSAKRLRFPPNLASDVVGFRLVMVP